MLRHPSHPSTVSVLRARDLGIDERDGIAFSSPLGVEDRDEHAPRFVHLRRRQADARILVHRLDHVIDELLELRRADLVLVDRARRLSKHRVTHAGHFQNGHLLDFILGAGLTP